LNNIVNKYIPKRTPKQYRNDNKEQYLIINKIWKDKNKDKLQDYYKTYYENNKIEKDNYKKEYNKQKFTCECGKTLSNGQKYKHNKTKKHLLFINNTINHNLCN